MSSSRRKAASAPASPAAAASPYARPAKLPAASGVGMVAGEPLEDDPTDEDLKEMITSAIDSLSDPPTATWPQPMEPLPDRTCIADSPSRRACASAAVCLLCVPVSSALWPTHDMSWLERHESLPDPPEHPPSQAHIMEDLPPSSAPLERCMGRPDPSNSRPTRLSYPQLTPSDHLSHPGTVARRAAQNAEAASAAGKGGSVSGS